jgi:hypothetical protein
MAWELERLADTLSNVDVNLRRIAAALENANKLAERMVKVAEGGKYYDMTPPPGGYGH